MRIRKPRVRSEQPSLQPQYQPLLHLAQVLEKDEGEDYMRDTEPSIDFSHAAWDQSDSQRNSTAPSTESEELPEMETGKEVAVRSVNPSLRSQDGEEHVTSMDNSLEVNGHVGMKKQGEDSEKLTGQAALAGIAVEELRGTRNLCPLLIEESASDSELPSSVVDPCEAPEGSLLHTLYLLVLGGDSPGITEGITEGITVRELFKCLQEVAEVLDFRMDWKVQVRRHLKTNPHFREEKGYHRYRKCDHQLEVQQSKNSPANIASTSRLYGASSSKTVLPSQQSTPATVQTGLSVDTHEGGGQTRRKAFRNAEKAIANAAMSEQATEFEKMYDSMGDMQMPSSVADRTDSQLISHGPLWTSSGKRKSLSSDEEELPYHGHPVPGGLQATQAEILARTEVQTGQSCVAVLKDDTGNWRCNMMAMADDTLCNHHRSLNRQHDGKISLSPNSGSSKHFSAFRTWIAPEADVQTGVQCGHSQKFEDGTSSLECCSRIAVTGHTLCEYHKAWREGKKARQLADAQQGKQVATSVQHNHDSSIMDLPESHTNVDLSSLSLHPESATISPLISREDSPSHTQAANNGHKPATGVSNQDDDSHGEQLQQQKPKNVPQRRRVAARKTASNVGPLKRQDPVTRTPTIPPLPPPFGIRRKTPLKN